jgi:protein SCO1
MQESLATREENFGLSSPGMIALPRALGARIQVLAATLVAQPVFWSAVVAAMFSWPIVRSVRAERNLPRSRPVLGQVRGFTFRDQNGAEVGVADLRGRLWVASFASIGCAPACGSSEAALAKMDQLRRRTRNLGDAIRILTFTVDGGPGTATSVSAPAATRRVGPGSWRLLAGPPARVHDVLADFRVSAELAPRRIALVDAHMRIRGYYDLADDGALDAILRDISLVLAPDR